MIPPILEVYVLWHPDDEAGQTLAKALLNHFHGPAFTGLLGGAVEVYTRSAAWNGQTGPPRPVPPMESLPNGLEPAAVTVIVPILGVNLARAVEDDDSWRTYLEKMCSAIKADSSAAMFYLALSHVALPPGGQLTEMFGAGQALASEGVTDSAKLCADLSHSIIGFVDGERVDGEPTTPVRVFVSHTKHEAPAEMADDVPALVAEVRKVIGDTHLWEFFDKHNLQPGVTWQEALVNAAGSSALLIVRTDLYASREWCQQEVLAAKRADMPLVVLDALHAGEERGCFLMDHMPSVALRTVGSQTAVRASLERAWGELIEDTALRTSIVNAVNRIHQDALRASIEEALNKLIDEALKRALWRRQRARLESYGFHWLPANAPEPTTLAHWLRVSPPATKGKLYIMHPDPPLGDAELSAIKDLLATATPTRSVEILTPRTFASRGGQVPQ